MSNEYFHYKNNWYLIRTTSATRNTGDRSRLWRSHIPR